MVRVAAQPIQRDAIVRAAPWVALLVVGCLMAAVAVHQLRWWVALSLGLPLAICSGASERSPVQGWQFFSGLLLWRVQRREDAILHPETTKAPR
jgi:hypothetical protein